MESVITGQVHSVYVPLPKATERRLRRWSVRAEGASWPSFGGHITLIPSFRSALTVSGVEEAVERVCRDTAPFVVQMDEVIVEPDIARSPYYAVFLTTNGDGQNGYHELVHLRSQLLEELAPVSEFLKPELVQRPFLPHISVALSVGEAEAHRLARQLRADDISVRVQVAWVDLLVREADAARHEWNRRTRVELGDGPDDLAEVEDEP